MSHEATSWALQHAVGVDADGNLVEVPAHTMTVLLGLANHAHPDGTAAWPSQAVLARYSRKTERAVRKDLAELKRLKIIGRGDQRLVEHIPADERPVVYDLQMHRCRPGPGRNPSSGPQGPGGGTTVPGPAGQQVPPGHDRPEPEDRPEPQFRPEPDGRTDSSGPEHMGRNHSSGPEQRDRNYSSEGTGTVVPTNRPRTKTSSSSSTATPASLVDRYARAIGVIRRHLPELDDDDEAAAFAEWLRATYRVQPALLGAYVRRMALAGDLAGAYAEHRAGARPAPASRPVSLIALDQRNAQRAQALSGDPVRAAAARVRAELRPTRTPHRNVSVQRG